jgi:hypothetical protein
MRVMMDYIQELESFWSAETGALYELRQGVFDEKGLNNLLLFLKKIAIEDESSISRRLVALLWYIPLFISWQYERFSSADQEKLSNFVDSITNVLEEILGVP